MPEWTPRRLYELFPLRRSSLGDQADLHTLRWFDQYELATGSRAHARIRRSRIGQTVACSYPAASQDMLEFAADLLVWLVSFDDMYIDAKDPLPSEPASQIAAFAGVLDGQVDDRGGVGHEAALADLVTRARRLLTASQAERLAKAMLTSFLGQLWEVATAGKPVKLSEYKTMRRHNFLAAPMIVLVEPAAGLVLPETVHTDTDVRRLTQAAQDLSAWLNDLHSFTYEKGTADALPRTLPTLIAQENNCTLTEAFAIAAQLCDDETELAHRLSAKLHQTGIPDLGAYAQAMSDLIGSNAQWYTTERYSLESIDATVPDES